MTYYVRRDKPSTPGGYAYVGPIKTHSQAIREVNAWNACDSTYDAVALESTVVLRARVAAWRRAVRNRAR
jgi:hypothetical protein